MLMPYTGIRQFDDHDLPAVADLHRRVMRPDAAVDGDWIQAYRTYFREVFLSQAALGTGLSSLVYQREGRIRGFLGVMPRRMRFRGAPLLAAVCSQFVVDPAERGQVGLQMLKRCFAGNQDVSITDEAADCTRKIWEWCGGAVALPYSMHWIRPLRPARAVLPRWLSPVARLVDAGVMKADRRVRPAVLSGSRETIDDETLLACLEDCANHCSMAPAYDVASLGWALERARRHGDHGMLRALVVKDDAGAIAGWFIYHGRSGGRAEVLQIGAVPRQHGTVFSHLLDDAWHLGAAAASGRFEPAFAPQLSENGCLSYRRGYWTLIHSQRRDVTHAIQRGDALLTRLEGEWCLHYS